jgi:hypothetical protein
MAEENPYKSPAPDRNERQTSVVFRFAGAFLVGLAFLVWLPMTIAPLAAAITHPEKDLWIKLAAGSFNGLVMIVLFWLGRRIWRSQLPKPPKSGSEIP